MMVRRHNYGRADGLARRLFQRKTADLDCLLVSAPQLDIMHTEKSIRLDLRSR